MKDKVVSNTSHLKFKKTEVEEHPGISIISNQTKSVTTCNDSLNSRTSNVNAICATCGKCVFNSNHDACVSKFLNDVNARTKKPKVVPISTRKPKSQANKSVATYHCTTHPNSMLILDALKALTHLAIYRFCATLLEKYLGIRSFCNDQFAPIHVMEIWFQGNNTINMVYYARRSSGNDSLNRLIRGTDLYPILSSRNNFFSSNCLNGLKHTPLKHRQWHRRLSISTSTNQLAFKERSLRLVTKTELCPRINYVPLVKYTWTLFLRSKDETPEVLKDFLTMIQRNLQAPPSFPNDKRRPDYDNPDPAPKLQNISPSADTTVPSQQESDLLFGTLYDEFFNDGTSRVNKSSFSLDNSAPQDTHPSTNIYPTSEPSTPTNVHAEENNDNQAEFTNPFCTPV
ncbi:hypothetical protein Tco_0644792 [Tanacetum coccineum]